MSTDLYQALLESAPDAIVVVDTSGTITLVNTPAERLFGYARTELVGQPIEVLIPERFREVHPTHREGYFADPRPRPMGAALALSARRKDGTAFPVDISLSSIQSPSGLLVSAAVRDITERRRAERERAQLAEEVQQLQRLESIGQLAGGIAHDFNNILVVIRTYAGFVLRKLREGDSARADVEEIRSAADRGAQLTRQLLIFSRRDVPNPQLIDINAIVRDTEKLLRPSLGEHVELRTDLAEPLPPVVMDRGRLEQVLLNLAVNARDAMPHGGQLIIRTAAVTLDETVAHLRPDATAGPHVQLTVSDTGVGIPEDVLPRIFEPFFTTKPRGQGTGLGLSIVYGIVRDGSGRVAAYSEVGRGTTVRVYLPVAGGAAASAEAAPAGEGADAPMGHGQVVLLVEDEAAVRAMTARLLEDAGYRVLVAVGSAEALTLSRDASHIDILVTDVLMPGMSGRELTRLIVAQRPGLPVLYISGYPRDLVVSQGMTEPSVDLVEKPFAESEFLARVHRALARDGMGTRG